MLANRNYRAAFFVLIPVIFLLLILIPINAISGNDFSMQFSLYKTRDYFMLTAISAMASLFFLMHVYNFKRMQATHIEASLISNGGLGASAGTFASVFGAATCPMCVASLFGFLGFGAVGFLIQYQWWIFVVT